MIARRWLKPLGWVLLGFAGGTALSVWHILGSIRIDLAAMDDAAMVQHLAARDDLLMRAAREGCVGNAELARAAQQLGWRTEFVAAEGTSALSDPGMASGLRVWILPVAAFSKNDDTVFHFDIDDCLILPGT